MDHAKIRKEELFMEIKGGKGYTIADIEALPDGERAELIDGELFMICLLYTSPSPRDRG